MGFLSLARSNTSSGTRIDIGVVRTSCSIRTVRRVLAVQPSELELLNCGLGSSNNSSKLQLY